MRNTECSNITLKAATTTFKFYQRNHWEHPKPTFMHWRKLLLLSERKKNQPHFSADKKLFNKFYKKLVHYDLFERHSQRKTIQKHAHTHTNTHTHTKTNTHRDTPHNIQTKTNTQIQSPEQKNFSILFNCSFGS